MFNHFSGKVKIITDPLFLTKNKPRTTAMTEIMLAGGKKEYIPIFAWGNNASFMAENAQKGDEIYISDATLGKYDNTYNIQIKEFEIIKKAHKR